ncbi:unnamed protein product [Cladocopium goreaui]|uniref:Histone RNA hairpin-binding protein RNA-binding domain-containing protein n=1 Tax=Cladocopium goreaui TaxID=2562237 RepID=A0A9P1FHX4_9DINO|nr:unnamed protein product [Cladocopium goreaui]CAI4015424.1 unnamed protein product [Cladocopium goreaui]|mmetsp:Transcript_44853/g.91590  ORF Transcript_44853/g.91590 Transcript_44853/m.91590 type:complete len:224 (-) Transcript_44853:95-766(-)
MAAAAARPRWADLVDSSQEDADVVGPLPGLLRRDSWQDSQSQTMNSQNSQSSMCELLQATDLASQPDLADVTEDQSAASAVPASAPEPRRPLSSVLTAAATKERKRHGAAQPSPVAKKRYRARKASARDDDETSASNAKQGRSEESIQQKREKRREVLERRKRKPDYQAYAAVPKNQRAATPDPEEDLSKRPWECKLQHWRKAIRTWYTDNGGADADDISESE